MEFLFLLYDVGEAFDDWLFGHREIKDMKEHRGLSMHFDYKRDKGPLFFVKFKQLITPKFFAKCFILVNP